MVRCEHVGSVSQECLGRFHRADVRGSLAKAGHRQFVRSLCGSRAHVVTDQRNIVFDPNSNAHRRHEYATSVFLPEARRRILSDWSIARAVEIGLIEINPFDPSHVQAASYDLMLIRAIELVSIDAVLADAIEHLWLPDSSVGVLSGRSSIARHSVAVHCTVGYIDPGFDGTLTLALKNLGKQYRSYQRGARLAQIQFAWIDRRAENPYQGRYQLQSGPTESRFQHGDQ